MSDTHTAPTGSATFSAMEIAAFKKEDVEAAGNIVKLMVGIFIMGLILYGFVCYFIVS
jgi:hypothetical protein